MDAGVLQKYEQVKSDAVLKNVFDFDQFLRTIGMHEVLMGFGATVNTTRYDFRNIKYSVDSIKKHLKDRLDDEPSDITADFNQWDPILFDICFEKAFVPFLTNDFRQSFNNTNISQTSDIRKQVEIMVTAIDVNVLFDSDGRIAYGAMETLPPAPYFSFGESLYVQTAEFDVAKFKTMVIPHIATAFKPYFYYKYLLVHYQQCNPTDQKCVRIYMLACLVYIYYFVMSLFLIIFATHDKMIAYKSATDQNDISINECRRILVHIMDNTLVVLNDDSMRDNGEQTDIRDFYNTVKEMSLKNIKSSNNLVKMKNDITILQNNLSNYNAMESVTSRQYFRIKVWFYVSLVFWIGMTVYMVGLTLTRSLMLADILTALSIIVCILVAIYVARR